MGFNSGFKGLKSKQSEIFEQKSNFK